PPRCCHAHPTSLPRPPPTGVPNLLNLSSALSQPPADLPTLHPFPTRRSSDLTTGRITVEGLLSSAAANVTSTPAYSRYRFPAGADRKSTRLNSSHEWISYAVFCLKKKTKVGRYRGTA